MSVAGSFYPDSVDELKRYFSHFDKIYDDNFVKNENNPRAVIVPHAGYIYSGFTASVAYNILKNSEIKTFVIVGPSHKIAFDGISICESNVYDTPLGTIESDTELVTLIKENFKLNFIKEAHVEHSTETQFPFVKYYLPKAKIVELVYSNANPKDISKVIDLILEQKNVGVIISTDLSHFYNLEDAKKLDNICLNALNNYDLNMLHKGCEACGIRGVEAMMISAKKYDFKYRLLDYRTSADFSKDESRVVGYMSAYFH